MTIDRASLRHAELVVILAVLSVIAALAIDMYLPALPTIGRSFPGSHSSPQLTLSAYFLGFAVGQALYGPVSDRFGRKPPLYFGISLYVLASLGCAFAPTIEALAGLRFMQAAGGCAGAVVARAMVRDLFTGADAVRVFSRILLVFGLGPILAPLIGGYVLIWFGWQAIFLLLTAVGAFGLVTIAFRLPETRNPAQVRPLSLVSVTTGYWRLLRHRNFVGHSLCGGTMMAGTFAYIAGSPFVVTVLFGVPPEHFGWVFGSNALGFVLAAQVNVRMQRRISTERVLLGALLFQVVAVLVLATDGWTGAGGLLGILLPLFFWIAAMGFVLPNTTALAMGPFGANAGAASALLGTLQFLLAAGSSELVGKVADGTARPMTGIMALCSLAALAINRLVVKHAA